MGEHEGLCASTGRHRTHRWGDEGGTPTVQSTGTCIQYTVRVVLYSIRMILGIQIYCVVVEQEGLLILVTTVSLITYHKTK